VEHGPSYWDNFRPEGPGPTYRAIYRRMARSIETGRLVGGRRLPSQRLLADKLGVSIGTVTRAYNLALANGLIRGSVGRGTYVRHYHPMGLTVVDRSRIPPGTLDLYQNFPVIVPQIENRLWEEALADLAKRGQLASAMRASWSEESAARQHAGVSWISRVGLAPAPGDVFDCPGVQAALCAIFGAVVRPGDTIVAPTLSHPGVKLLAEQYSAKLRGIEWDDEHIVPEAFEALCAEDPPRLLYCAPTIHSPTTVSMPAERRRAIAEIARRHDVIVIEDESAAFLLPEPAAPLCTHAPERTFFVADVWMALSLGLRTTYVLTPPGYRERMATAVAATCGVTALLVAEVARHWIESPRTERLIRKKRAELAARNEIVREELGTRSVRFHPCGHHIWLELPEPWTSERFVMQAEKHGVAINGAEWFAVGHGPLPEAVRVCIGIAPDRDVLRWALHLLNRLIDEPRSGARPMM
jgi:DNA-binding transcriptional MocR family regulator